MASLIFNPRLTKPEDNSKYYISKTTGGYNPCILGNEAHRDTALNVLPNCVGYSFGRFHEILKDTKFKYACSGNAENLFENLQKKGLTVGQIPRVGALMVWQKGKTLTSVDGAGHIANVEAVISNTQVLISESGWNSTKPFWTAVHNKGNGNWLEGTDSGWMNSEYKFLGFIYNPNFLYMEPTTVLAEGNSSEGVKWLQWRLNERMKTTLEVDGIFGPKTKEALVAFQEKFGLTKNGLCDWQTRVKLRNKR